MARQKRTAPVPAPSSHETIYLKLPRDLMTRIRARAAELGYPHTITSVATLALTAQFPPAVVNEQEKAS